jgi:amidase
MNDLDLCFAPATCLAGMLSRGEVSARELVGACLEQIAQVNPQVNAIVTLTADAAVARAAALDEAKARGAPTGPLHGLPIAHKDLFETRGVRTTYGSPIFRDHVPDIDALVVERAREAGAISLGKTNTPEFGAGSQTFNPIFGRTSNPYDLTKTCGGSSGGAAVALACGLVALADGTDFGGSLRNPASFCNVVGLRPSPGRVPSFPARTPWLGLSVDGPMGRTVGDVALLLSAQAGPDPRSPIALGEPGAIFRRALERDLKGIRIAWAPGFGLPFESAVRDAVDRHRTTFASLGCVVEDAEPDLSDADRIFKGWRAWCYYESFAHLLERHRHQLKDTVIWNVEQGAGLTGPDLASLDAARTTLFHRMREFMTNYEFIVLPVAQVVPFDLERPYVDEIDGVRMESYIDWMRSCYYISTTGHPALAVPAGFTGTGLPVGLQIVGRHRDDWGVLQLGHAFEQATGAGLRRPPVASGDARR